MSVRLSTFIRPRGHLTTWRPLSFCARRPRSDPGSCYDAGNLRSGSVIDHYALFDDVVAVAKKAHAATAGWRAICVRAQRAVGKKVVQPLAVLDLDEELSGLATSVRTIARKAPSDIDTLVFGLFDGVEEDGAGIYTGFHLAGAAGFDPEVRWLLDAPTWKPENRFLASASLDAIVRAGVVARGEQKKAILHALRFGAASLLSRFASEGLPYRVVVAFDDGDFAEIRAGVSSDR